MGFLTRLLAGLTAAAALGAGLTGTANAVDTTGVMADTTGTTKSVVKLSDDGGNETSEDTADNPDDDSTTSQDKATAKSSLPDHIVNGSFDYPACPDGKNSCDVDPTTGWGGFYVDYGRKFMPIPDWDRSKFGWDSSQEGLRPDQQPNSHQKLQHCVQIGNKPNNNGQKMNRFAEIIAETPDEYIYQDIATTPGVMYRWSLKHASENASHVDSMQVMIGSPGKETAQDATRTTSNGRGDRTGVTSKTIATKGGQAEWETYTGVYIATSTVTRFTFKSAQGRDSTRGNFIDDVMFTKAYKLTYDKNSADASGQVPSNQRGKENTTQPAKTKTNGKIRLASDTSKLSDHLINSDFEYLPDGGWKTINARYDMASAYTSVDPNNGQYIRNARHADSDTGTAWVDWDGFDASKFAWRTDQKGGQDQGGLKDRANAVELQQDSTDGNTYAEMVASETGRTIYQDLKTIPGTLYKIRLKHASLCKDNVDKMQVVINGTPIEMTRVTANGKAGDKVGEKSTTIGTRVTNENRWHHADQWETYEGYYVIPDGQTTTRFGFKAVNYLDPTKGNLLDDVTFARAYKLSYDKNASDATGSVPSNQRGKENTVQPAESKTDGNVKTVSDDAAGRTVLECKQSGEGATGPYADKFCWIDWSNLRLDRTGEPIPVRINVPGGHIDADATITHTDNAALTTKDFTGDKWSRLIPAYRLTGNTALAFHHIQGNSADPLASVMFSNITPVANQTAASVNVLKDFQLAFGDAETMSGYVVNDRKTYEQTDIESDKMLDKLGMIGDANPDQSYSEANIGYGTTHVTLAGGPAGKHAPFTDDSNSKGAAVIGATQPTRFKVSFKQVNHPVNNAWSAIAVGVYMPYLTAYPLTYDKNSSNATGEVPSNQRGRENTVQPAKAKTTGTVKTVADENVRYGSLANGDFSYPSFSDIQKNEQENNADLRTFLKSDDGTLWYNMSATDLSKYGKIGQIPGFDSSRFAWSSTENGSRVELQQDRNTKNTYAEIVAQQDNTSIYQNVSTGNGGVLYKIRLKHASRQSSHADRMQVLVGSDTDHATPVEMTRVTSNGHGDKVGGKSTTITTKVSNTDPRDHGAQWETYEGYYQVPEGQKNTVFMFKSLEGFKEYETLSGNNIGNLVDDIEFSRSYKLTYDANSSDASGQVPSDTTANTVKQAKSKTAGTVRTVSSGTDGKVSDLVQRTTTHEDGSVTVRTIDTSTDVVSGCQVYYPAGQRITLATMAKDDDCWDSSMLSRPGHTQLGWNQGQDATQAQAQVTMVEGGMTVYAVWVGNPVLTYDTNKPSTWGGQMPSTPASVSVPYNTPAADGSGWRAGDVSKIRGYRFLGWYSKPQDGAGLYDWTRPLTGSVTVYAHWQRLQANVIYDKNASDAKGSHANTTGWQYSDVTVPSDTSKSFTRDGYVFKGWSLKAGKADVVYKDGSQIPLQDKDITLYAQWQGIHENFTETGGISLPLLIAGGIGLLVMGVGSTVMLTRRMNGHGMPDGE